jgi:hypothetical protein
MTDKPELRVVKVPKNQALYDEFARSMGYRDEADLIARAEAERAALDPGTRALVDEVERRVERSVLGLPAE